MNFDKPNFEEIPSNFQNIAFAEMAWAFSLNTMQRIEEALKSHAPKIASHESIRSNLQYYLIFMKAFALIFNITSFFGFLN